MMKKYFLLSCLLLGGILAARAQITITDADMPSPNDRYFLSTPDTLFGVDVSQTGTNFNWDFSGMTAISQRRDTFMTFAALPFTIKFVLGNVNSNLVQYLDTPDSVAGFALGEGYQLYDVNGTNYEDHGLAGTLNGLPLGLLNNPSDKVYFFPLTYGDEDSSMSVAELDVPGFFFIRQERKRVNNVDGWGDITTPYGTFNSIRIASSITGTDTISFDTIAVSFNIPTTTEYKWLGNGMGLPLMQVNTTRIDSLGGQEIVTSIRYQDSMRTFTTTGIRDFVTRPLELYPNPSRDKVSIQWEQMLGANATLEVLDITGRTIQKISLQGYQVELNVQSLPSGTYQVRIVGQDAIYTGKLRVIH